MASAPSFIYLSDYIEDKDTQETFKRAFYQEGKDAKTTVLLCELTVTGSSPCKFYTTSLNNDQTTGVTGHAEYFLIEKVKEKFNNPYPTKATKVEMTVILSRSPCKHCLNIFGNFFKTPGIQNLQIEKFHLRIADIYRGTESSTSKATLTLLRWQDNIAPASNIDAIEVLKEIKQSREESEPGALLAEATSSTQHSEVQAQLLSTPTSRSQPPLTKSEPTKRQTQKKPQPALSQPTTPSRPRQQSQQSISREKMDRKVEYFLDAGHKYMRSKDTTELSWFIGEHHTDIKTEIRRGFYRLDVFILLVASCTSAAELKLKHGYRQDDTCCNSILTAVQKEKPGDSVDKLYLLLTHCPCKKCLKALERLDANKFKSKSIVLRIANDKSQSGDVDVKALFEFKKTINVEIIIQAIMVVWELPEAKPDYNVKKERMRQDKELYEAVQRHADEETLPDIASLTISTSRQ